MVSESVKAVMDAEKAAAADIEKAREDAKRIVSDARADGERIIAEAVKNARVEAESRLDAAKKQAEETAAKSIKDAKADVELLKGTVEGRLAAAGAAAMKVFME